MVNAVQEGCRASAEPVAQGATAERKRPVYPLCAPDRMVDPAIFAKVQEQIGAAFSFDAACNEKGTNALCSRYATMATFASADVAGEALWCCVSPQDVRAFQQHYYRSKRVKPHQTSAVFVVPKWPHLTRYFSQLRYKLVQEFPAGTSLFVSANAKSGQGRLPLPPIPWPVQLWYDPPAETATLQTVYGSDDGHAMRFDCQLASTTGLVLVDSGARTHGSADGFVGKKLIDKIGMKPQPCNTASVRLANGQQHPLLGSVSLPIRMGPFRDNVRLLVMHDDTAEAHVILGTDWLKRRQGRMCWETDTLSLQRGGKRVVLRPKYAQRSLTEPQRLMNWVAACLLVRCVHYTCLVTQAGCEGNQKGGGSVYDAGSAGNRSATYPHPSTSTTGGC